MPRREAVWLGDMLDAARRAHAYVVGFEYAAFVADEMRLDATVRQLEIVGEACKSVSEATRQAHPEIAWRQLGRTRDRLIHSYFSVDAHFVWSFATHDLPPLIAQLEAILKEDADGSTH